MWRNIGPVSIYNANYHCASSYSLLNSLFISLYVLLLFRFRVNYGKLERQHGAIPVAKSLDETALEGGPGRWPQVWDYGTRRT